MAKIRITQRETLIASVAASVLGSVLSIGIGLYVVHDIGDRCRQLETDYLQRKRIAMAAADELAMVRRAPAEAASAHPFAVSEDRLKAAMARISALLFRYQAHGEMRGEEPAQLLVIRRRMAAYRASMLPPPADLTVLTPPARRDPAEAAESLKRALDDLASIAGERANAYGKVIDSSATHIAQLFLLIALIGILSGIPPALWVVRLLREARSQDERSCHSQAPALSLM